MRRPLDVDLDTLVPDPFDVEEVRRLFDFLEFRSLYERLHEAFGEGAVVVETGEVLEAEVEVAADPDGAAAMLAELAKGNKLLALAPAWEGDGVGRPSPVSPSSGIRRLPR